MPGRRDTKVTRDTCIRMLPYSVVKYLSTLLDIDKKWERLVGKIPKKLTDVGVPGAEPRYSHLQIRIFENKSRGNDGSPTQAILDDWSTQNTKVYHLIAVLSDVALYEAADYLSVNVLHGEKVPRNHQAAGINPPLPSPMWEPDQKPKFSKPPNNEDLKPSDKETLVNSSDPYSDLSYKKGDPPYSQLQSEILYLRAPSYDSEPSVPLKGSHSPMDISNNGNKYESAETFQVRKVLDHTTKRDGPVQNTEYHSDLPKAHNSHDGEDLKKDFQKAAEVDVNKKKPDFDGKANQEGCHIQADMVPSISENKGNLVPNSKVPGQKREPVEADETINSTDHSDVDYIYSVIGSQEINYELLGHITDNFNTEKYDEGGRLIGCGGFGEVFLGIFQNGYKVAIKRLKKADDDSMEIEKQFRTELDSLITYRHQNIVHLYGYSIDGPGKCLIYEYLSNGSLEDRLDRTLTKQTLPTPVRIKILQGTADGIVFLNKQGIIHRDIKSANVLLDEDFSPKVGDFATARGGPRGNDTIAMSTKVVIGTSVYLAPEAMHFDVSTKLDSYSFGIVILEVITGLPALDPKREDQDIKSHVDANEVEDILDTSGGDWSKKAVETLLEISEKCTLRAKRRRCNVEDVLSDLYSISC